MLSRNRKYFEKRSRGFSPLNFWVFNANKKKSYLSSATPFPATKLTRGTSISTSHFLIKKIA